MEDHTVTLVVAVAVPALGEWGVIVLVLSMGALAVARLRHGMGRVPVSRANGV